jgi:hypothetical protein
MCKHILGVILEACD